MRVPFHNALLPILVLLGLVVYGLILRPQLFGQPPFPLEEAGDFEGRLLL